MNDIRLPRARVKEKLSGAKPIEIILNKLPHAILAQQQFSKYNEPHLQISFQTSTVQRGGLARKYKRYPERTSRDIFLSKQLCRLCNNFQNTCSFR
nr:CFF_HP1_G0031210.mRNA.1.CDS.1 [Saccharomyces cerevisiae]